MKRGKNAVVVLTVVAAVLFCLSRLDVTGLRRTRSEPTVADSNVGQSFSLPGKPVAGLDLYPKDDETEAEEETNEAFREAFPDLFETRAQIITFGARWCAWCGPQKREVKRGRDRFNVIILDIDEDPQAKELVELWDLGDNVPVTVIVERGIVLHRFSGYTEWNKIEPHAEKARKNGKTRHDDGDGSDDGVDDFLDRNRRTPDHRRR